MNSKIHVTIAIPAYNEQANIGVLLFHLNQQIAHSYVLDTIRIICDGSTDGTLQEIKKVQKTMRNIDCIYDFMQRGVRYRLGQFMKQNTSEILIFFDADTLPVDENTIEHIVEVYKDPSVMLATTSLIPDHPITTFESILYSWRMMWTDITTTWKNGNNIYTFRGAGLSMRKSFGKNVTIPEDITGASSHYLYLKARALGMHTAYCKNAGIRYRLASTLRDYLLQVNRGSGDAQILKKIFIDLYNSEYTIPTLVKYRCIVSRFIRHPIDVVKGYLLYGIVFLGNQHATKSDHGGVWKTAVSTKKLYPSVKNL